MADARAIRAAAACLLAAAGLAGCGGKEPAAQPTGTATVIASAPAEPVAPLDPIRVSVPRAGQAVTATAAGGGRLRATIAVRGRGAPEATVLVSGGCAAKGCEDLARAAGDGRWKARLTVVATRRRPRATISVASSADAGNTTAVTVRLRAKPRPAGAPAAPASTTAKPAAPLPAPPRGPAPRTLVMIGDSLAEGTEPLLGGLLPGWQVSTYAQRGRPLADGMRLLAATGLGSAPIVLAMSLFTNDDPRNAGALESAVRTSVSRAGGGCAVWATIVRPPLGGVGYQAANDRLERLAADPALAGRLLIVPWARQVAAHPGWLAGDGVHATPEGYRARAQMYADAARACGG